MERENTMAIGTHLSPSQIVKNSIRLFLSFHNIRRERKSLISGLVVLQATLTQKAKIAEKHKQTNQRLKIFPFPNQPSPSSPPFTYKHLSLALPHQKFFHTRD